MTLWRTAGLAIAGGLLTACAGLPDLERGRRSLQNGDLAAAERDLRPLAAQGYAEAQFRLAQLYGEWDDPARLRQAAAWYRGALKTNPQAARPLARILMRLGDSKSLTEAERLLRQANPQSDPLVLAALIEFYTDYPERDRKGQVHRLLELASAIVTEETQGAVIRWYRANSDNPRYARQLVTHCREALDRAPECHVDLARHYRRGGSQAELAKLVAGARERMRAGTLPVAVVERLGWALVDDEIAGTPRPEDAYVLLSEAARLSASGRVRLAHLIIEYPFLNPAAQPEQLLLSAFRQGSAEAALALGRLYMTGTTVSVQPTKAEHYLKQAARSLPSAHYYLGRIYRRGDLGTANPVLAAEHLLAAGRKGHRYADLQLARLFSDRRGVRPDYVNAYVFASLAARQGVPEAEPLAAQLHALLDGGELRRAQRLLQQETAYREAPLGTLEATATAGSSSMEAR